MANEQPRPRRAPKVYILAPGQAIAELMEKEPPAPLGPLAEPEPMVQPAANRMIPYGPWAGPRFRTTKGLFLDRYAC